MTSINATNLRKDIFNMLDRTIKYNEPILISTKDGNAVLISEEEYNDLVETIYLSSIPGMKETIIEGLNTSVNECILESEVDW